MSTQRDIVENHNPDTSEAGFDRIQKLLLRSMFTRPTYYASSAWIEHVPFAFWVIEAAAPRFFVELGTHYGVSYFAFCQSADRLELDMQSYAIDTWSGDEHAGVYGPEVLGLVQEHNRNFYSSFSRLVQSTFDEALEYFADGTIDLIHIDGLHTYDAVKQDFESWLPKLSTRAVVLFHDTNVRERDFGVAKLFEELREEYPYFEFLHGNGLGVLGVGPEQTEMMRDLYAIQKERHLRRAVQEVFGRLGQACMLAQQFKVPGGKVENLKGKLQKATRESGENKKALGKALEDAKRARDEQRQLEAHVSELKKRLRKQPQDGGKSSPASASPDAENKSKEAGAGDSVKPPLPYVEPETVLADARPK
jgi:methyltransferase family protein